MGQNQNFVGLRSVIAGRLIVPDDREYGEERRVWNSRLDKRPAAILQCSNASDVAAGVRFAEENGFQLAVRGGGHSYAGFSTCDDALMIDFARMKGLEIDVRALRGIVEPGVRWGEFYKAALPHGLAPAGGTVSSVGVAGYTLGGGTGWLARKHGLGLDNLISVEVVTASGDIVTASETENDDLFWGIRGGAGNLGIVTQFTLRLHPVPGEIFAGQVIYPLERGTQALRLCRDVMANAPDGFTCYPATFRVPPIETFPAALHGEVVVDLILGHIGDIAEGEAVARPLREIGEPIMDLCATQPFGELLQVFDAGLPPGQRWYSRSSYLKELSDPAIDVFLDHSAQMCGGFTFAYFEFGGGAVGRVPPEATAFPHRDAVCDYHILAGWPEPGEDQLVMDWVAGFHQDMRAFSDGSVYVNLLAEDEQGRVREAFGSNFDRLMKLKKNWDPKNVFRSNLNLRPA